MDPMDSEMTTAKVLYLDDEKPNLISFKFTFKSYYDIATVDSASAALELLKKESFDVIIADQRMPGMSGVEFFETIKEHGSSAIHIIMTGHSDFEAAIKGINQGGVLHFIKKPWDEGEVKQIIDGSLRTVTLERKLQENEQRFRDIAESYGDWVWEIDSENRYTYAFGRVEGVLGYTPDELMGKTPFDIMKTGDGNRLKPIIQNATSIGATIDNVENWFQRKDNQPICLATNAKPLLDSDGLVIGFRGVDRDITERKLAEKERQEHQTLLEQLVEDRTKDLESANRALKKKQRQITLLAEITTKANETESFEDLFNIAISNLCEHLGWPIAHACFNQPTAVAERSMQSIWHVASEGNYQALQEEVNSADLTMYCHAEEQSENSFSFKWFPQNNPLPHLSSKTLQTCGIAGVLAFCVVANGHPVALCEFFSKETDPVETDVMDMLVRVKKQLDIICERKFSELAIRESEERYSALLNSMDAAVILHDRDTSILFANEKSLKVLRMSWDEVKGQTNHGFQWPLVREDGTALPVNEYPVNQVVDTGEPVEGLVIGIAHKGEEDPQWILVNATPLRDHQGTIVQVMAVFFDITELRVTQEELHLKNQVFEESTAATCVTDRHGVIHTVNPAFLRLWKYSRAEAAIGAALKDLFLQPQESHTLFKSLVTDSRWKGVFDAVRTNSTRFKAQGYASALHDDSNQLTGYQFSTFDITEHKKHEDQLRLLWKAIESGPNIVIITDAHGNIEYVNTKHSEVTGYSPAEVIGKNPRIFSSGVHSDAFYEDLWKTIRSGKAWHGELCNKNKDGSLIWEASFIAPVTNASGTITHYISVRENITKMKETETRLRDALRLAEEGTKAKNEFIANMSHELRTPLNAIVGMAKLLHNTPLSQKQTHYLEKVESSTRLLTGIVSDVLDFSKIEAGAVTIESTEFKLNDILRDLRAVNSTTAHQKGLEILYSCDGAVPSSLMGDPLRLNQVLNNLLSNAIKFTEKGTIILRIETLDTTDHKVQLKFSVQDPGIGMTEDYCKTLFEAFTQADSSTTRKYGGTGLGLSISKRFVELMDGKIWVDSAPEQGSTFYFTVPLALPQNESQPAGQNHNLEQCNVLIVDEGGEVAQILRETAAIRDRSVTVISPDQIDETFAEASIPPFNLIFINSTNSNSLDNQYCANVKSRAGESAKIILATRNERTLWQDLKNDICDGYLLKPFTNSEVLDAIVTAVEEKNRSPQHAISEDSQSSVDESSFLHGSRVLLVEDNEINQQVAAELMEAKGAKVTVASNGAEAIQLLTGVHVDLILMDIQMPVMDGYAATKEIRQMPDKKDIPIIAITANASTEDRRKTTEAGMNAHISKPIDPDILYNVLTEWLKPASDVSPKAPSAPAPQPATDGFDNLPGIDINRGLHYSSNKMSLYKRLLQTLRSNHARIIEDIRDNYSNNQLETAERLAHTLKSMAGNIGATPLYDAAQTVESAIRNKSADGYTENIHVLEECFKEVLDSVNAFLGTESPQSQSAPEFDLPSALTELEHLKAGLNTDNPHVSEQAARLLEAGKTTPIGPHLRILSRYVEDGDNESALAAIEDIEHAIKTLFPNQ